MESVFGVVGKRGVRIGGTSGQLLGLQAAESLLNHRFSLLGIEVADQDKCHIIRHIPSIIELNQFAQTRVL